MIVTTAPAHAGGSLEWEPVGQTAAGGSTQAELAAIAGVPYVAWVESGDVRVSRLGADGTWQPVGSAINHDASKPGAHPHLADIDGTPWITWVETDANGTAQLRVARLTGGSWQEVVGGDRPLNRFPDNPSGPPINAEEGRLASFGGSVYVAFREEDGVDTSAYVSRLSADDSAWQPVGTLPNSHSARGSIGIVVSAGQLYVGYDALPGGVYVARLDASGTSWTQLGMSVNPQPDGRFVALSDASGTLEVLWTKSETTHSAQLSKLTSGNVWVALTSDSDMPGVAASITQASGRPYVASLGNDQLAHVNFLTTAWEQAPDPSTQVAPSSLPSLATIGDDVYVGYQRGGDECVARLESEADSSADDDSCGPAFGTPLSSQPPQSNEPQTPLGSPAEPTATHPHGCRVPRLKGKTIHAARILLARAHCRLGHVTRRSNRRIHHGRVIASAPSQGSMLPDRARVRLIIAR